MPRSRPARRRGPAAVVVLSALAVALGLGHVLGSPREPHRAEAARPAIDSTGEQDALALAPPGGSGPADQRVRRAQAVVRAAPSSVVAWVALGRAWVQKARNAADPGYYLDADACAARALALDPDAPGAWALRAAVKLEAHRFDEARVAAEEALRRAPDDRFALGVLADALVELGRYRDAAETTDRLMRFRPDLPAYVRASYLFWLQGREGPALEAARRAIDAGSGGDPEPRAWAMVQAAMIFWHRGDHEGANAGFDRALEVLPGYPPALVGKGRVALAQGDARGAADFLERAWRASPRAETAWLLGDARAAAGNEAGARASYAELERLGRAAEPRVLALFLATKGRDPGEALRLAGEEYRVRPDLYGDDALAWALYRAGRLAEARAASARALRLGTPDARLLYHAGAIRIALGERAAGLALVRRALSMNPGFDWTGSAEARRLVSASSAPRHARTASAAR